MDSLRSLLVHLDGGHHSTRRLHFARALAARHEATLSALCAVSPVPQALADLHRQDAKTGFDRLQAGNGWPMQWLPPTEEQAAPAFIERALHADLLVLGQYDPHDEGASTVPRDFVPSVLLGSGTPAMVLPSRAEAPQRLGVVLVAWRPGRQSARALTAALPVLQQADEVHLLTWMDTPEAARSAQDAVADHLALHGVGLAGRLHGREPGDPGGALLSAAEGLGADLLVMGCYGHSPTRELVLGGATRTVLQQTMLPVLMAH